MQQRPGKIRTDLARLKGARLITASESDDGQPISEAVMKQITGGDAIVARHLYAKEFEFVPQFTIFLATNHKPHVRGVNEAIWRRLKLVPFKVEIPRDQRDPDLEQKLLTERSGILNWLLEGCRRWKQEGLNSNVPTAVQQATSDYKSDSDRLSDFFNECCALPPNVGTNARALTSDLYRAYTVWCGLEGDKPVSRKSFTDMMEERGYPRTKSNGCQWYTGLNLAHPPQKDQYGHEVQYKQSYFDTLQTPKPRR